MAAAKSATNTVKSLLRVAERPLPGTKLAASTPPAQLDLFDYCFYYDTLAPTPQQLQHSADVFRASNHSPIRMWTASEFRTIPMSDVPEVAFLGRSNSGKSSLLNAIMEKNMCFTSATLGLTTTLNAYGIGGKKGGEAKVVLVDTPGYGKGSNEEWGEEILKYLTKRKQLRRTYILINSHHGIKAADAAILSLLRANAVPHQIILSKADSVLIKGGQKRGARGLRPERIDELCRFADKVRKRVQPVRNVGSTSKQKQKLQEGQDEGVEEQEERPELGAPALGEILACSMKMKDEAGCLGVDPIRWSILRAVGLGIGVGVGAGRGGGGADGTGIAGANKRG
ncbi:hypothetical protein BDFG_04954 [Blastomyces dermatitidis ATCC 26199]|nr:hypothetical protein BDFG_04954 [Blastomyces dermatitidis ATCC 26199]